MLLLLTNLWRKKSLAVPTKDEKCQICMALAFRHFVKSNHYSALKVHANESRPCSCWIICDQQHLLPPNKTFNIELFAFFQHPRVHGSPDVAITRLSSFTPVLCLTSRHVLGWRVKYFTPPSNNNNNNNDNHHHPIALFLNVCLSILISFIWNVYFHAYS